MTRPEFIPRLMKAPDAARYLGVSETTLHGLPIPRRMHRKLRLYDRYDLDAFASSLPLEGEGENPCDEIFGLSR